MVERTEKLVDILAGDTEHAPINMDNLLLRESMDVIGAPLASLAPFYPEPRTVTQCSTQVPKLTGEFLQTHATGTHTAHMCPKLGHAKLGHARRGSLAPDTRWVRG